MRTSARALLALFVALAAGCATPAPPPPIETGQLFLWEVERSDGAGGVAHLFGTVHLSQEALHFDPAVEKALAEAETLVLEVDPSELQPATMQALTTRLGMFQDGRTLDQVLGPEAWARLSRQVAARGLPVAGFRLFEPWLALLTLQMTSLTQQGFEPEQGVESGLVGQAVDLGKPTLGLETVEEQLGAFDSLPLELQVHMLEAFLAESEGTDDARPGQSVTLLVEAWRKGDAERIEAEVFGELARDPSLEPYFESVYFRRNREMAFRIGRFVDEGGRWFVAVGAAHMVGATGLPNLLTESGYDVERVPKTGR